MPTVRKSQIMPMPAIFESDAKVQESSRHAGLPLEVALRGVGGRNFTIGNGIALYLSIMVQRLVLLGSLECKV